MSRLRAYLELVRLPNIFTAMADILAGYVLAAGEATVHWRLAGLLVCSACLYAAGIVMNDLRDIEVDRGERPSRPLPSGRVSMAAARHLAVLLCATALFAAAASGHRGDGIGSALRADNYTLWVAAALLAAIAAYDWLAKDTLFGPPVMGICRGLNLLLGASLLAEVEHRHARLILMLAAALTVYVASMTWFGRDEAGQVQRRRLISGLAGILFAIAALGLVVLPMARFESFTLVLWLALLIHVARIGGRCIRNPTPAQIQHAMKTLIFGIIAFDAVIASAAAGWTAGLVVLLLLAPTALAGRWIYST